MNDILDKLTQKGRAYFNKLTKQEMLPVIRDREILFLYDDPDREIKSVRLVHHVSTLDRAPKFQRTHKNGPFALHLVLPKRARMEYTFGITYVTGAPEIRTDPHNPKVAWCPFGPTSVALTEQYEVPQWLTPINDIPRGSVETHQMDSTALGDKRTFLVYTPANEPNRKKYPVLLVMDGPDYINYSSIIQAFDHLIGTGRMTPVIAILSKPENRNEEYSCTMAHPQFLMEELLPWVHKNYPVSDSRQDTCIMGSSFGAITSVYTAFKYPHLIGKLFIQSGSFRFQDIVRASGPFSPLDEFDRITYFLESEFFPDGPGQKMKIFHSCGTFETILSYNRQFASEMRRLRHQVEYTESNDGHNWVSWRDHFEQGFSYLFPPAKSQKKIVSFDTEPKVKYPT